ncbi:Golgi apyrase [Rhizina undulata]
MPTDRAVILDAGSSGTRIYVYEWEKYIPGDALPDEIKLPNNWNNKKSATGGMRSLRDSSPLDYKNLNRAIDECIRKVATDLGLNSASIVCETISGEDEALFGWLAVNFNKKHFHDDIRPHGFMEIGGQSAQIAFCPFEEDITDYNGPLARVEVGGEPFDVFVRTWPALGADAAWRLHIYNLLKRGAKEDPCLPYGYRETIRDRKGNDHAFDGTGKLEDGTAKLEACEKEVSSFILCDENCGDGKKCVGKGRGCLLENAPSLGLDTANRQFLGTSVYWHAINFAFSESQTAPGTEESYNLWGFRDQFKHYCEMDWNEIVKIHGLDKEETDGGKKAK